ncbi:DUF4412 domain-containing protein [Winogradskyella sp.]|jgi:outer membrane lipoprotein-sorting protein|uniref:DUF4412 domain-containing protein n=1 Tax=Winogradskyella sp. TaxID=1883156 RepID=UPI0025F4028D|nr:DUF4412 domain-containing protein [Winogradskyella sp.]MCT4630824.1 DUF4412 domain-containing protein [Winogradskyella sp.]
MKKILVLAVMSMFTFVVAAQEKIKEGIVTSKQTMTTDNEQMQAQFDAMGDMMSTIYFKGTKSRVELSNPMSGDVVVISDSEEMQTLTLMNNPMLGKKFMLQNVEVTPEMLENVKLEATDETKTIIGYECKLYHVTTTEQGVEVKMDMYVTEEIAPVMTQQTSVLGEKLKGFPLYMEMHVNQQGMSMVVKTEVTELKKETVSDDKFSMTPPEGYTKMEGM